jgi:HK97 gp10 family phage protein
MPEDFAVRISSLADRTDEIVPKVLRAGAEVVLAKVKSNLQAVIGKGTKHKSRSTGELVSALGISPAGQDRNGNHNVKIGFDEPRGDGGSNAQIANVIEYGKSGQPAKPFLTPAKSATRKSCIEAMKTALESELENI